MAVKQKDWTPPGLTPPGPKSQWDSDADLPDRSQSVVDLLPC